MPNVISPRNLDFRPDLLYLNGTITIVLKVVLCWVLGITKTCPCNEHPLTPHFYIVKLGFTGVYIIENCRFYSREISLYIAWERFCNGERRNRNTSVEKSPNRFNS